MKVKRYHECPECHKISPYLQSKCDCGYRFSGSSAERQFKTCSACGSLVPVSQLFCACGKFLPLQKDTITEADVETAYQNGRFAGIAEERARNEKDWVQFFADAGLKNTITGAPILSRQDFADWKAAFYESKKRQESEKPKKGNSRFPHYSFYTKEEAAYDVISEYAYILEKISPDAGSSPFGIVYCRLAGALCAFSELVLRSDRDRTCRVIEAFCESFDEADRGYIRREMMYSADSVGLAMDGKSGSAIISSASFAIQKIICAQPDIAMSARIAECLVDFSKKYVDFLDSSF